MGDIGDLVKMWQRATRRDVQACAAATALRRRAYGPWNLRVVQEGGADLSATDYVLWRNQESRIVHCDLLTVGGGESWPYCP